MPKPGESLWTCVLTHADRSSSLWWTVLFWIPQLLATIWGPSMKSTARVLCLIGSSLLLSEYCLSSGPFQRAGSSTVHSLQVRASSAAGQFWTDLNIRPEQEFWEKPSYLNSKKVLQIYFPSVFIFNGNKNPFDGTENQTVTFFLLLY